MDLEKQLSKLEQDSFNGQISISDFRKRVQTYAETYHALQLQQAGVKQSVLFEDDLVTYETALLAWEKGFNIDCGWKIRKLEDGSFTYTNCSKLGVEQPTQSLLKKWLREKHNIHVNNFCEIWSDLHHNYHSKINFQKDGFWEWFIPTKGKDNLSYKDALEIGLYKCLQLVH